MILLSALLASLSGLVAGERMPVGARQQVEASAFVAVAEAVAVAAVSLVAAWVALRGPAAPQQRTPAPAYRIVQPSARRRLALKQSWLN